MSPAGPRGLPVTHAAPARRATGMGGRRLPATAAHDALPVKRCLPAFGTRRPWTRAGRRPRTDARQSLGGGIRQSQADRVHVEAECEVHPDDRGDMVHPDRGDRVRRP